MTAILAKRGGGRLCQLKQPWFHWISWISPVKVQSNPVSKKVVIKRSRQQIIKRRVAWRYYFNIFPRLASAERGRSIFISGCVLLHLVRHTGVHSRWILLRNRHWIHMWESQLVRRQKQDSCFFTVTEEHGTSTLWYQCIPHGPLQHSFEASLDLYLLSAKHGRLRVISWIWNMESWPLGWKLAYDLHNIQGCTELFSVSTSEFLFLDRFG
jgi:hypothetical protein